MAFGELVLLTWLWFTRCLNPAHLASLKWVFSSLQAVWFWFLYTWVGKYWLRVLMYVPFKKIYDFTTFFARLKKWTAHLHNDSRMDCCWKTSLTVKDFSRNKKNQYYEKMLQKKSCRNGQILSSSFLSTSAKLAWCRDATQKTLRLLVSQILTHSVIKSLKNGQFMLNMRA